MNSIIRLNVIPTEDEIKDEIKVARNWPQFANNSLIKDLWPIVFSFLFGFTDHLVVSVPLQAIVFRSYHLFPVLAYLPSHTTYLSYFYGWEDQGELELESPSKKFNKTIMVSGHYPLAFCYHTKTMLYISGELDRRCLVQMTFDPLQMPRAPKEMWFVWHKSGCRTFTDFWDMWSWNENNTHPDVPFKDRLPLLKTAEGELSW